MTRYLYASSLVIDDALVDVPPRTRGLVRFLRATAPAWTSLETFDGTWRRSTTSRLAGVRRLARAPTPGRFTLDGVSGHSAGARRQVRARIFAPDAVAVVTTSRHQGHGRRRTPCQVSVFEAHDEPDARRWLNRVRVLISRRRRRAEVFAPCETSDAHEADSGGEKRAAAAQANLPRRRLDRLESIARRSATETQLEVGRAMSARKSCRNRRRPAWLEEPEEKPAGAF